MLEFGLDNLTLYSLEPDANDENTSVYEKIYQLNYGDYGEYINKIILSKLIVPSLRF